MLVMNYSQFQIINLLFQSFPSVIGLFNFNSIFILMFIEVDVS